MPTDSDDNNILLVTWQYSHGELRRQSRWLRDLISCQQSWWFDNTFTVTDSWWLDNKVWLDTRFWRLDNRLTVICPKADVRYFQRMPQRKEKRQRGCSLIHSLHQRLSHDSKRQFASITALSKDKKTFDSSIVRLNSLFPLPLETSRKLFSVFLSFCI